MKSIFIYGFYFCVNKYKKIAMHVDLIAKFYFFNTSPWLPVFTNNSTISSSKYL